MPFADHRIYFFLFRKTDKMGCTFSPEDRQTKCDDGRRGRLVTVDGRRKSTKVVDAILQNVTMVSEVLTEAQVKYCMRHLSEHQLFNGLSQEELRIICTQMVWMQGKKSEYLFHQGQTGHSFFLIEKGKVSIELDQKKVAELDEGQSFGQLALLFRASRAASVKCLGDKNLFFVMKPALYRSILQQLKTAEYSRNKEIVEKIALFQCLTNKQKFSLANSIKITSFKQGDTIFSAGDVSNGLFIVSDGLVQISLTGKQPITVGRTEMFGESALKDNGRRQGSAKCLQDTTCLVIGKKDMEKALGSNLKNLLFFNIQKWSLIRVPSFCAYNSAEMNNIIMGFESVFMEDGQKIQGSKYKGLVIALQGGISNQPQGTLFNIDRWLNGSQKGQNLVKNKAGYIGYLSFEKLNEIVKSIQNKQRLFRASQRCIPQKDNKFTLADFEFVRKLGEGQFGQVHLVKNKQTGGGLYAVKCISKAAVRQEQMELSVIEQKKILEKAVFPFIVGFVQAFHDSQNIFLLMEYLRGKEMFDVIRQMPTLNKPIARYYFGCIMLSVEYLHANNIIYRDIKPQNSVIDHHGKAYLIDLGTAKELNSSNMFKTFTIIGTPHYMAPQVFEGKGYSFQADYWSLGVLLYEFICGRLPFGQSVVGDPYSLYGLIKKSKLEFPKYVTDEKARNLVQFLLVKDPKARSQYVTFDKIKTHEYFNNFNWIDLLQDKILPPYIPRDFRLGTQQTIQSTGTPFLKRFYSRKQVGPIEEWDETIGI